MTHHNALNEDLNLRISLELYLKRLIVGGLERVYEMGRVFRNEGLDVRHNPEFTLLEIYQAYTDFHGMMDLVEELYRTVALKVLGTAVVTYDGVEIDLSKPFARMTMVEAVKKYAGVDFAEIDLETARSLAKERGIEFEERHKKGDLLTYEGEVYRVAQDHTSQAQWVPGSGTESLYTHITLAGDSIPVWQQPTGAHDAYNTGDKVHYPDESGPVYVSKIDGNTWSPDAYPAGWELSE